MRRDGRVRGHEVGRDGQLSEQALVRLGPHRSLPAGTDLVSLELRPRPVERTVAKAAGNGRPTVSLHLSRAKARISALPLNLTATATVRDENGQPMKGARVTFTIAPPYGPTDIFEATTDSDGEAAWSRFRLLREGATRGPVIVTVRVVTPGGRIASRTAEMAIK